MRRTVYFIGLCLMLTIGLYGCGNTTTSDSGQPTAQAKSAKVNFNVTFPPKGVVKSLIPQGTAYVTVYWSSYDQASGSSAWGDLTLYPDADNIARATAEMVPGFYFISAYCYDKDGYELSSAQNYAQVGAGTNNIVITFVQGRWTFVNSAGAATPISLSALSGSASLSSFDISGVYSGETYPISWNLSNSSTPLSSYLTYRSFSGDLSQLTSYAIILGIPTNLPSGTTRIDALDTLYNLTDASRSNRGAEQEGDRIFMFASVHPSQLQYLDSYGTVATTSTCRVRRSRPRCPFVGYSCTSAIRPSFRWWPSTLNASRRCPRRTATHGSARTAGASSRSKSAPWSSSTSTGTGSLSTTPTGSGGYPTDQ